MNRLGLPVKVDLQVLEMFRWTRVAETRVKFRVLIGSGQSLNDWSESVKIKSDI